MNRTIEATLRITSKLGSMHSLRQVQRELGKVYAQAEMFNRRQGLVRRTMSGLGAGLLPFLRFAGPVGIGYSMYRAGKWVVGAASTMEDALFGIQKKTGATEEQLESLRQQIKDLARDVPVSMDEIAAAFERGGAAGIPLDQLRDFARLSVQVADAWEMSAEDVANAFAGFEAGMGIPRKELEAFADLINHLADSGIADERDIVAFIDRVGASLKNFGLAREEIAAIGTAMLNLKIPAEVGARAMDTLTGKLIAPSNLSPKARGALTEIVGDLDRFAKLVEKDAAGALDLFFQQLEKFSRADRARLLGGLLGEGFDDEVMRLSAGLEELTRNMKMASEDGDKYLGSIAEAAERKTKLWSSQIDIFKNNLKSFADSFGAPILRDINQGLTAINEMMDRQAEIGAGRSRLTAGGFSEAEYLQQWQDRYRAVHGDPGWSITAALTMNERWREDLAAYGRGEIRTVFGNLDREAEAKAMRERLIAGAGEFRALEDMRRSAVAAARGGTPVPEPRPAAMPLAEQLGLYGAATASERHRAAYRELNRDRAADFARQGTVSAVGGMESRLERAGVGTGELQDAGKDAGRAFREEAARAANEIGEEGGSAFNQMLRGMSDQIGREIGAAAVREIRAGIGGLSIGARVNADTGRSGGDVATTGRPQ